MNNKKVIFDLEARTKLVEGIDILANAVKTTLGPKGRCVIIDKPQTGPYMTKDGVSIAREIKLEDAVQNTGVQLVKSVAAKTAISAGDGTTTATVLTQAIVREGMKCIANGYDPINLKKGIDLASQEVIKLLKEITVDCKSEEALTNVGTISANGDVEIGKLLAKALITVGENGVVTIENGTSINDELHFVQGVQFDRGFISPYFITDVQTNTVVLNQPYVMFLNLKLTSITSPSLIAVLETLAQNKRELLIIVEDIENEALNALLQNKIKGILKVAVVKAPGFGNSREAYLEDMAILTGGKILSLELGDTVDQISIDHLGKAEKVTITKDMTTIVGGKGSLDIIEARVEQLKNLIKLEADGYEKVKLQERLSKLDGGVAVIKVGANSELELKEKHDRVEDALFATKAALEEGVVTGGGAALLYCKRNLENIERSEDKNILAGYDVLFKALEEPFKQIVANAGRNPDVMLSEFLKINKFKDSYGYNAATDAMEDLLENGVLDPMKITKTALNNAVSVAGMVLTASCIILEEESSNSHTGMAGLF